MEDHDLDLDNYKLNDILNLFKVPYDFDEKDLKRAYRQVLMIHPDKSKLDAKYFHFYVEAYKILSNIYYFHHRKKQSTEYEEQTISEEHKIILDNIDKNKFNEWFNKMFEKVKILDNEQDSGYEKWLRSNKDIFDTTSVAKNDMDAVFEKRKKQCRDLVVINDLQEIGSNGGYELARNRPKEYSSEIFSKLTYDDLKKAHIETVVPVTKEDYDRIPKFKNVESYVRHRKEVTVSSLDQAKQLMAKKKERAKKTNMERAFYIYKQDEQIEKMNKKWWGQLKHLTNK